MATIWRQSRVSRESKRRLTSWCAMALWNLVSRRMQITRQISRPSPVLAVLASVFVMSCAHQPDITPLIEQQQSWITQQTQHIEQQDRQLAQLVEKQDALVALVEQQNKQLQRLSAATPPAVKTRSSPKKVKTPKPTGVKPILKHEKAVIGRIEWAWIHQLSMSFKARVDTGAKLSSLHADSFQPFERDGEKWIRFTMVMDDDDSDEEDTPADNEETADAAQSSRPTFEAPLVRYVKIRQASLEEADVRPVVRLKVRVGNIEEDTEFTLNDRNNMLYPVLLGRAFFKDLAVVDVARRFVHKRYQPTGQ